jgi:hypothetical protein
LIRLKTLALLAGTTLLAPLVACGESPENSSDPASISAKAEDRIQSIMSEIPESRRADIQTRFDRFRSDVEQKYQAANQAVGIDRDRGLAGFANYGLGERAHYQQRVEEYQADVNEREAKNDTINVDSARANLAEAKLQVATLDQYVAKARAGSPFADEVTKRVLANVDEKGKPKGHISNVIREVEAQPCLFAKGQGAKTTAFSMRGIELGMDRNAALAAICESQKGKVELLGEATKQTFGDPNILEKGARLVAMEDYRAGKGNFDQNLSSTIGALSGQSAFKTRSEQSRPFLASTKICLGCEPGIDYNWMIANYLPNGKIYSFVRNTNFVTSVDEGGVKASRNSPRPLKAIFGPLEAQYGKPSFVHAVAGKMVYGWAFPDRKSALPTEDWKSFYRVVKPGWGGFSVPEILLNGKSIMGPDNKPSLPNLGTRPPAATYCLVESGLLTGTNFQNMAYGAVQYGGPARKWGGETQILVNGKQVTSLPYDRKMEGSGYTPKCGIAILAIMSFADTAKARDGRDAPSPDELVQSLDMTILDVDQGTSYAKDEVRQILGRQKTVTDSLDRAAKASADDFQP